MILQKKKYQILVFLIFISIVLAQQTPKCCLTYDKTNIYCLSCQEPAYIYGNNCMLSIDNCKKYSDCFGCAECEQGFKLTDVEVKGLKTKKCQPTIISSQIDVQKQDGQGRPGQSYKTTDEYMKAYHLKEIKNGKPVSGFYRKYENGSQILQIQYQVSQGENQQNKYYRGTMQLDLKLFSFNELEFKQIKKSELNSNIITPKINKVASLKFQGIVGTQTKNEESSQIELNLSANQNENIIKDINQIAQGPKSIYNRIVKIITKTYKNRTQVIQVFYQRGDLKIQKVYVDPQNRRVINVKQPEINLLLAKTQSNVSLILNTTKPTQTKIEAKPLEVKPVEIKLPEPKIPQTKQIDIKPQNNQTTVIKKNQTAKPIQVSIQDPNTVWPKTDTKGYEPQNNMNLLKNTNFLVCFDILRKKYKGYSDILPKQAYIKTEGDTQYFLLYFQKSDNTRTEILAKIKSKIIGQIVHEHSLGKIQKPISLRNYKPQQIAQVTKSTYFIPSAVQMTKSSQNYIVNNIKYIAVNEDQPNNIYYRVIFCSHGIINEVQVQTKKKLRTSQVLADRILKQFDGIVCKSDAQIEKDKKDLQNKGLVVNPQTSNQTINNSSVSISPSIAVEKQIPEKQISPEKQTQPEKPIQPQQSNITQKPIPTPTPTPTNLQQQNKTDFINKSTVKTSTNQNSKVEQNKAAMATITKQANLTTNITLPPMIKQNQAPTSAINPPQPKIQSQNKQLKPLISKQNNSQNNSNSSNTQLPKAPASNQTSATKTVANSSTIISKNEKPAASLPLQKCPPVDLPQQILTQITGFNQILQQDAKVKKIIQFAQKNQAPRLDNSCIVAQFYKPVGLTTQYKLYFLGQSFGIIQVFLVYDTLKSRMYILNFTPVIFKANN